MKKMKKLFAALIASVVLMGTAAAVTPSDIFLNYGGNISEGDSLAKASIALPWTFFNAEGDWKLPTLVGEYEYAVKLGPVPFSFGGYAGISGYGGDGYGNVVLRAGGSATYHMAVPPVKGLDVFASLKLGLRADIGSDASFGFEPGFGVGVAYFFNDSIGITGDIGYPSARIGAIFKF